jgi:hypothetical protein
MKIRCSKCGKCLGEIRDGTLRRGVVHLCGECWDGLIKLWDNHFVRMFGG